VLRALDTIAHFLYCPAMAGRRIVQARWYHRIHLIPGWLLARICDRYEERLLAPVGDESTAEILAAFERGEKFQTVVPSGFRCDHMDVAIAGARWTAVPEFGCGCRPAPVFR
jgi:hypothetical protein